MNNIVNNVIEPRSHGKILIWCTLYCPTET